MKKLFIQFYSSTSDSDIKLLLLKLISTKIRTRKDIKVGGYFESVRKNIYLLNWGFQFWIVQYSLKLG